MPTAPAYSYQRVSGIAVTNRYVTSVVMKATAYTLANTSPADGSARPVVATVTKNVENDTMGNLVVVGTDANGTALTETIALNNGDTAGGVTTTVNAFRSITSLTTPGWVTGGTADNIIIGYAAPALVCKGSGVLHAVVVNTTAAGTCTLADSNKTLAVLKSSIAEGTYYYDADMAGQILLTLAAASDVTALYLRY